MFLLKKRRELGCIHSSLTCGLNTFSRMVEVPESLACREVGLRITGFVQLIDSGSRIVTVSGSFPFALEGAAAGSTLGEPHVRYLLLWS